jgi:ATP-dependent helicase/nuclease subunit A
MSRRLLSPMPEGIVTSQRRASDPARSVWVTANAGSGKTYVLTARVLRLLLSGTPPEQILCLTYTKAAAAEMRGRVSERLARWALAGDVALVEDLTQLAGSPPTAGMLLRARSLFAHALETPGGLRIQTIHAFCEAVLHRFPQEAGVPFDFMVLEEHERDSMLLEAREAVLATGLRGGAHAGAVETLFDFLSDFQIETAIVEALNQQRTLRKILPDRERAKRNLRQAVGVGPGELREAVITQIAEGYIPTAADHRTLFQLIAPDPDGDDFVDRLARIDPARPEMDLLFSAYLTQNFTARKTLIKKQTAALIPDVAQRFYDEAARLERLNGELTRAELVERSEALLEIVGAIAAAYEDRKRARSLLDFDDLIERLGALLRDEVRGIWVRYKLDSGISHILVDEGQDTNPQQWEVIEALIAEFFYGESAADRPRTLFVVGDQKQSIFSFQGADPQVFVDLGRQVYYTARSVSLEVAPVRLNYSFRTLGNLLSAVDRVFERPDLRAGALEEDQPVHHDTARAEAGGRVTLWPPLRDVEEQFDPENWPTQPPLQQTQSAARRVAEKIAREIKAWIDSGRALGPRGRAVTADDVLILVQVRSVLFHEIIRALVQQGLPTPGADRLAVTTHIGALDLMALGDVLSNPADDLQLAALLRSPLFDVSEDDLRAVAQPRDDKTRLWYALKESSIPAARAAYETLRDWRRRLDFERPFNFYSDVLYREGGLKKMRRRFGAEIDDVVAEFLDLALGHEQSPQPSLLGFLAELRSREVTIKRELGETNRGVRVMTVHGAKGLEAPIVILADAASTEIGRDRRSIFMTQTPPLFFHASSKEMHVAETLEHRADAEAAQKAEYWRKLYVAMTRAEDELYVTGTLTRQGKIDGSWYEAIEQALRPFSDVVRDDEGVETALAYPQGQSGAAGASAGASPPDALAPLRLAELPAYRLRRIVRPSTAFTETDPDHALDTPAERVGDPRDPEAARAEGIALHALLQHLMKVPQADWPAVSAKALGVLLPDRAETHAAIARKAQSILTRLDLVHIFGPNSRAEVPILAHGTRNGVPITIAGRIDRLVVEPGRVLVVDYKSDAQVPATEKDVPAAYVSQLGLYAQIAGQLFPGHRVEAAILWTSLEMLMNLAPDRLAKAVAGFTIG